jgi:nitrite reductase/ring-hydroxylating ferredoxin subunit
MTWTRVASAAELSERDVLGVASGGEEIALYWIDGAAYATSDTCTHALARLSEGFLDGDCIECPIHQALFNVKNGEVIAGPATWPIKTYPCRIDGGDIWIDV